MHWKLPLRWGLPLLLALWVGYPFVQAEQWKLVMLVAGMGVALWTAFSLPIAPRPPERGPHLEIVDDEPERPQEPGPEDDEPPGERR